MEQWRYNDHYTLALLLIEPYLCNEFEVNTKKVNHDNF